MQYNEQQPSREQQQTKEKLESMIQMAIKKSGVKEENQICRFLPIPTGGYIHHFTMRKMKYEDPSQLMEMIDKYILKIDGRPLLVQPKPRAARGSRKRSDQITFSKQDLERMLNMARQTGDKEMVRKLTRKTKDRKTVVRELISSIRQGRVELELWNNYVEVINAQNSYSTNPAISQTIAV